MATTLCIYTSYSLSQDVTDYIQKVIINLQHISDKIVFATNKRQFSAEATHFFSANAIQVIQCSNKGFDFGKIYIALQQLDCTQYDRIIFVNDSLMQIGDTTPFFDWINKQEADVLGLINSYEKHFHLQSFFLVINKKAILPTLQYFAKHKRFYRKQNVIKFYELGFSKYWLQQNLILKAFIDVNTVEHGYNKNPMYEKLEQLLQLQIPYIKRHVLMDSFGIKEKESLAKSGFVLDAYYWKNKIDYYYNL
jgi:lipopolysaccharide biosynthesis protein